jgi:hypothetical protein
MAETTAIQRVEAALVEATETDEERIDRILAEQAAKKKKPAPKPKGPTFAELRREATAKRLAREAEEAAIEDEARKAEMQEEGFLRKSAAPATDALSGREQQIKDALNK